MFALHKRTRGDHDTRPSPATEAEAEAITAEATKASVKASAEAGSAEATKASVEASERRGFVDGVFAALR